MASDLLYWVWLAERLGPGSRRLSGLVARFDSAYEIYRASDEDLMGVDSDGNEKLFPLSDKRLDHACEIVDYCARKQIEIVTYDSKKYPARLKSLQDPPAVLYVRGKMPDFDKKVCIGIVGTRKMSEYGKLSAYKIAYELTAAGAVVVSGMALGVDGMAAVGALSAKGATAAVFGCGVERAYPARHKKLMSKILENGCVISEFPPSAEPAGYHFPIRNRIISGLCNGTLVIEADESSGAMITARDAILQGRDIFAVPGNIDSPGSQGTNKLIHDGAQPVRSARDVLENYRELYSDSISFARLERAEKSSDYNPARAKYYGLDYVEVSESRAEAATPPIKEEKEEKKTQKAQKSKEEKSVSEKPEAQNERPQSNDKEKLVASLDESSRAIYGALDVERETRLDALIACGYTTAQVMAALTVLEIKGLVEQRPGGAYVKK